jgi:WD40 repeat protein
MRACVVLALAGGCSFGLPAAAPPSADGAPDTGPPPGDAAALGPWGTPAPAFAGTDDDDPSLTADLRELYFNRASDIYRATRDSAGASWSAPVLVAELSSAASETTPEITGDGLTIFIGSGRAGSLGSDDVWTATRASRDQPFGTPVQVVPLSSAGEDAAAAPTDDALAIVLVRTNGTAFDIFESTRMSTSLPWSAPALLDSASSTASDASPFLLADKLTLYFDSNRDGTNDLYIATRPTPDAAFGTPQPIPELNTAGIEADPWVSPDQRHIFFARDGQIWEASR